MNPVHSETSQAARLFRPNQDSIWNSWPVALSDYPRGCDDEECSREAQHASFKIISSRNTSAVLGKRSSAIFEDLKESETLDICGTAGLFPTTNRPLLRSL